MGSFYSPLQRIVLPKSIKYICKFTGKFENVCGDESEVLVGALWRRKKRQIS
jgi:hypothetical protein